MRPTLIGFVITSAFLGFWFFGIQYKFQNETAFVILADKVGNPAIMTTFRIDPNDLSQKDSNYCQVDNIYTPWNVSVFTAAQTGDVLKRYHWTHSYQIFHKTIWQDCEERYMPVKLATLYPDMNYWPFKNGSLSESDQDYANINKLIKFQH